jgi:hypothetical protein
MQFWQIVVISVAVVLVLAAVGWLFYSRHRSQRLRTHFGPEYDRTVAEFGGRRQAESELARREQRVRNMEIRPLSPSDRQNLSAQWAECQVLFVDDPAGAVEQADGLITKLLRARGYSVENPYDRIADISAAYPRHANNYRIAEQIVTRHHRGQASTEDLRKAFIHYRALFDEILGGQYEELKRAS